MINFSFFICIFLTSFSKNELTTIEALPQREKANLDIEVLKIKTEKITGVIYENENKIIFDFKDLKKAAEKKKITTDSNNYELFILENLDNAATYMKKNEKFKMNRIFEQGAKLRNGEKIKLKNISYSLIEQNREKVLEVSYDLKPETFYLGVINNKTGLVEKIYKAEFIENIKSDNYHIYNNRLIKEIIIDDRTSTETDLVVLLGTITYSFTNHSGSLKALSAIGIGTEKEWEYSVKDWTHVTTKPVDIINIPLVIGGSIHPYFSNPNSESNNLLVKKTFTNSTNKYITLAAFDQIAAQLKICIPKEVVQNIKDYASRPEHNDKDFVEILYNGTHSISLIPSSEGPGQSEKNISIPNKFFGNVITIPYPQIKFKKNITPTFEIETKDVILDFGTVLKGDNSKTATSKIVIKNLSSKELKLLFPNGDNKNTVTLTKPDTTSTIIADVSVGAEQTETSTGKSYFMLNGKLTNTSSATTEGEHKGQFYLNIELK
ncbi:hypothetical protein OQE61_04670 [Cetobacterium somerae]|uniref:hypothetical protein n=1 Tax=Cetobacterium somerae TaxID=188913 RepID=UPI00225A46B2|nr:hypothetical protein [Cetobacterium somerae]MCX3066783.1 hypothetical protein [Cetobacterium somerae]